MAQTPKIIFRLHRKRSIFFAWDVVQFVVLAVCLLPFGAALNSEGLALAAFKTLVQDPRRYLRSWNLSDESPCNWRGVTCDHVTHQVTILNLPRARLSGTISPQLAQLSQLRRVGLHFNSLSGVIPTALGNLTHLRSLYLHHNNLTATIPDAFCDMPALRILDLHNNKLNGSIPESFDSLNNLKFLNLSNNQLSGEVPGGAMLHFSASSFAGNLNLCGSSLLGLPACLKGYQWSIWKILVVCVAFFLLMKLVIGLLLLGRCLRDDKKREIHLGKGGKLVMFKGGEPAPTSKAMLKAVRKLQKKDIVGEGGYGVVYKMVMKNQKTFAVKRLKQCLEATRDFENELETLGELKHCNLVKLRGYCIVPSSKLLIYDFIPNGTVDQLLHPRADEEKKNPVDWAIRLKVAVGLARALAYLHHSCQPRVIHRDVSSTNVLLDADFEPYLSDFGLARLMDNNHTHVSVTVGGTYGYIAPDYVRAGHATEKTDVYSYGVILLELLSGRRPTDCSFHEEHVNLPGWGRSLREKNLEFDLVEMYLRANAPHQELAIVLEIALRCISLAPDERPRMDKVLQYLSELDRRPPLSPLPLPRTFGVLSLWKAPELRLRDILSSSTSNLAYR